LLVIDMQSTFCEPGSPAEVPASRSIVAPINNLTQGLRALGVPVFWVLHANTQMADKSDWEMFFNHVVADEVRAGTLQSLMPGRQSVWHELQTAPKDITVFKNRYSALIAGASTLEPMLRNYGIDTLLIAGTKTNISRILMQGRLGGTGRMVILPVDQGFEHGPARSFGPNPDAYDPHYHFRLALDAGLNAYAAPLGMIEAGAATFAGAIPTILKVNSSNSLSTTKDQAVTATVADALRLGCSAIGFTIYPGSEYQFELMEELRELSAEAKAAGLAVVVWSYPRGPMLDKVGETALDICAYAAHMAALLGAHIIKVKPPTEAISLDAAKKTYEQNPVQVKDAAARIAHVVQACFGGRRLVVFSGGEAKGADALLNEVRAIHAGGGNGSIVGRNAFQRPRDEALKLLSDIIDVYRTAP
jgi:class I fructose-bisphosphate aldolase